MPTGDAKRCSGPCDQGRNACPTPEACEVADVELGDMAFGVVLAVALVAAAIGCASLIAWAFQ